MAHIWNRIGGFVLPAIGLSAAITGFAAATGAHTRDAAAALPIRCGISVEKGYDGRTYAGRVHALEPVSGSYELSLNQSGAGGTAVIRQSGEFDIAAGHTETLGEATLGGVPGAVEAELTLYWNGRVLLCRPEIDL